MNVLRRLLLRNSFNRNLIFRTSKMKRSKFRYQSKRSYILKNKMIRKNMNINRNQRISCSYLNKMKLQTIRKINTDTDGTKKKTISKMKQEEESVEENEKIGEQTEAKLEKTEEKTESKVSKDEKFSNHWDTLEPNTNFKNILHNGLKIMLAWEYPMSYLSLLREKQRKHRLWESPLFYMLLLRDEKQRKHKEQSEKELQKSEATTIATKDYKSSVNYVKLWILSIILSCAIGGLWMCTFIFIGLFFLSRDEEEISSLPSPPSLLRTKQK